MPLTFRAGRTRSLESRLAAYAVAGGAVAAGVAGEAKADLITTQVNETIGTGNGQNTSYNLMIGGTTVLNFQAVLDPTDTPPAYAEIEVNYDPTVGTGVVIDPITLDASNLAPGSVVSASSDYSFPFVTGKTLAGYDQGGGTYGEFADVTNGYLGFMFADPNVLGQTDYGYVSLSSSGDGSPSASLTINSFTYDNMGNAVTTPSVAVPEPASLAMLAMGLSGVGAYRAWRRRKDD